MTYIANGYFTQRRSAESDDEWTDDVAPPVTVRRGIRMAYNDIAATSLRGVGADLRNQLDGVLTGPADLSARVDDLFTDESDGATYSVMSVRPGATWLLRGDVILLVRRVH